MSFLKGLKEWWDSLRGKGPAAAVALTLDLGEARDNKPFMLEAGAVFVERCDGDLYARVNGPNGDGINLRYVKKILYPVSSLYLTNTAQSGKSARLLLLPTGMDADPPAPEAAAAGVSVDAYHVDTAAEWVKGSAAMEDDPVCVITIPATGKATKVVAFYSVTGFSTSSGVVMGIRLTFAGVAILNSRRRQTTTLASAYICLATQHIYEWDGASDLVVRGQASGLPANLYERGLSCLVIY